MVQLHGITPGVFAEHLHGAGIRTQDAEQDPDGGGFPGTVRPQETVYLPGLHPEVELIQGTDGTEILRQPDCLYSRCVRVRHGGSFRSRGGQETMLPPVYETGTAPGQVWR